MLLDEIKNIFKQEENIFYPINRDSFNIPVDLKLDNMSQYTLNEHHPWIWFRNGYVNEEFLPLTIESIPKIPVEYNLNIKQTDFALLKEFVSCHVDFLMKIADEDVSCDLIKEEYSRHLNESTFLPKMWILMPRETGLPTRIYIDIDAFKKGGHYRRVKVQPELGMNNSHAWPYITIQKLETGYEMGKNEKRIPNDILNPAKDFISNNIKYFNQLFDGTINFEEFKKKVCLKDEEDDGIDYDRYIFQTSFANFKWCIAKDKAKKLYNIYDANTHMFVFDEWFGYITRFKGFSPYIEGYLNGIPYRINCQDKTFEKIMH